MLAKARTPFDRFIKKTGLLLTAAAFLGSAPADAKPAHRHAPSLEPQAAAAPLKDTPSFVSIDNFALDTTGGPNSNRRDAELNYADFQRFVTSLPELAKEVKRARGRKDVASQRFTDWQATIEVARTLKDPFAKISVIDEWVNRVVIYDDEKEKRVSDPRFSSTWYQTAAETIQFGTGTCGDQANLKLIGLLAAGFNPKDVRVLNIDFNDEKSNEGHAVVVLTVGNQLYFLNNDPGISHLYTEKQFFDLWPTAGSPNLSYAFPTDMISLSGLEVFSDHTGSIPVPSGTSTVSYTTPVSVPAPRHASPR